MKFRSYIQSYVSENVTCNILDKKRNYKENWAPNTQVQVWRSLLSLLYHIYYTIPLPHLLYNMFHNKRSVYSFTPCAIFGPLIIFRHGITKTQILIKVSVCIFHDLNHYKNNQNDQKQVNWSHLNISFIQWWFFLFMMVILPCHGVTKTLMLNMDRYVYGMILLTVKPLQISSSRI